MWTRSAKKADNTFSITVWDNGGDVYLQQDGFLTAKEADNAAEMAQRQVLFGVQEYTLDDVFAEMDDDELLAQMGA